MSGIVTQNVLGSSGLIKAVAGGGAWTEIKTLTSDGSDATMSFVDGTSDVVLDSTYPIYCFKFTTIHPETNLQGFMFNGSIDSGSNYNVAKTSSYFYARHKEDGSSGEMNYDDSRDSTQATGAQYINRVTSNDNDGSFSGYLYLFNPASTTFTKHFLSVTSEMSTYGDATVGPHNTHLGGYFNTTSAIDAIQFTMESGEIQGGKIKLFGIKDS